MESGQPEEKEKLVTIPNILSAYRLATFPFLLYLIYAKKEDLFIVFLVVNLVTDILDGLIARTFKMQTKLGARLDSLADIGTYMLAFTGIFVFKWNVLQPYQLSFFIFLGFYVATDVFALIKFGKFTSFHLYSSKIGGYLQGIFIFLIFVVDFYEWYYYIMLVWGILSFTEHLIIQIMIPELESNLKGLYWVLKNRNK